MFPRKSLTSLTCILVALLTVDPLNADETQSEVALSSSPNILLVVADDLGFLDIAAFGGEIRTPNIDKLAETGLRFTNFYASPTCSPSRAMLMTGVDSHAAGLGNMAEHTAPNQRGVPGYEGHLSDRVVTVATLLQDAGYRTYMAGKWHLGREEAQYPVSRGFDESFALLQGGATYFNDMLGLAPGRADALYISNERIITELPEKFYATEFYADFIMNKIESGRSSGSPFFAYLAFTAPHWPLQVKEEHIDLYKGQYALGYEEIYRRRIESGKRLGILPAAAVPDERPSSLIAWDALDVEQRAVQEKTMELYAAVIERMDYHLGRVLTYLQDSGELDNTLVIFMSDNGAEGADFLASPARKKWLEQGWNLSFENMGLRRSYVFQGPGWARASVGPYKMYKNYTSEGGIRTPLIVSVEGVEVPGGLRKNLTSIKDITPTILDYAGVMQPQGIYQGRVINKIEGTSLRPLITGTHSTIEFNRENDVVGWELFGHRAIRKGDWKLLWLSSKPKWHPAVEGSDVWGLYNIAKDPGELHNLAKVETDKFKEMLAHWEKYAEQNGVHLPDWD